MFYSINNRMHISRYL